VIPPDPRFKGRGGEGRAGEGRGREDRGGEGGEGREGWGGGWTGLGGEGKVGEGTGGREGGGAHGRVSPPELSFCLRPCNNVVRTRKCTLVSVLRNKITDGLTTIY
jgi:hypothetical protein